MVNVGVFDEQPLNSTIKAISVMLKIFFIGATSKICYFLNTIIRLLTFQNFYNIKTFYLYDCLYMGIII